MTSRESIIATLRPEMDTLIEQASLSLPGEDHWRGLLGVRVLLLCSEFHC